MKPGPTPTPPDDETPDPLLTTLRQRLGDYGAAPPPAAWAAIRQRVAAPPQPWWRWPRRLLPLLALLVGVLLLGMLTEHRGQISSKQFVTHHKTKIPPSERSKLTAINATAPAPPANADGTHTLAAAQPAITGATSQLTAPAEHRRAPRASATMPAGQPNEKAGAASHLARAGRLGMKEQWSKKTGAATQLAGLPQAQHRYPTATVAASPRRLAAALPLASRRLRRSHTAAARRLAGHEVAAAPRRAPSRRNPAWLAVGPSIRHARRAVGRGPVTVGTTAARPLAAGHEALVGATTRLHATAAMPASHRRARRGQAQRPDQPASLAGRAVAHVPAPAAPPAHASAAPAAGPLGQPFFTERGAAIDSLALKQAGLLLPESARPIIPATRPDSTPPAHAVRRWAVLVLAGPTLSYRTLGPAPTLAVGHPDFARLERPALGFGAQVQVRRVLSGRWALAVGVGFHEYATRLALTLKDTVYSVHQRDTYRLLTVPVQLGYVLGAPKGRLTKALLLGIEPGWYLGGRSTEGADCGCHQQTYSATGSPYRTWTLALSLGFDLRYRLGGADSRWQWLVQPTGRYVATPFVRSDAVGFTRRQPFSVGLLTGFSWDLR